MNNKPSDAAVVHHVVDKQTSADDDLLRQRVEKALEEADSPDAEWVSQEEVEAEWAVKRAEYLQRADEGKT